jgi:8-oxo-dGTP pyrophosphatase MutT (NUDIX family)
VTAAGGRADVPIRDASTVVLLRDGAEGLDVWLLTRVKGMAFAGGMTVFPGGRADEADVDLPFLPGAEVTTANRFGCDAARARMLVGAAIRETFEETGVLLATPTVDLCAARGDVEAGRVGFGDLLRANGLTVDAAALHPWSRWITPIGEVRRYDTHFFIGVLPDGADAADVTSESSRAEWLPVAEALRQAEAGERGLLPPTLATLTSLLPFTTVADVVAAASARDLEPISPTISVVDGNLHAELADGTVFVIPLSNLR